MGALTIREAAPLFGDRDSVILATLPLVYSLAHKCGKRSELEDLISEGTLALLEAYDRFDSGRGVQFSTFAFPRIKGAMSDYLRDKAGNIRPSQEAYRIGAMILRAELQYQPVTEIAGGLGITLLQATMGLQSLHSQRGYSLDAPLESGDDWYSRIHSTDEVPAWWLQEFTDSLSREEKRLFSLLQDKGCHMSVVLKLGFSPVQAGQAVQILKDKFKSFMDIRDREVRPMAASEVKSRKLNPEEAKQHGVKTVLDGIEWFTDTASPAMATVAVTSTGLNLNPAAAQALGVVLKEFMQVGYNPGMKRVVLQKAESGNKLSKGYENGGVGASGKRLSEWLKGKKIIRKRYVLEFDDIAQVHYIQIEVDPKGA